MLTERRRTARTASLGWGKYIWWLWFCQNVQFVVGARRVRAVIGPLTSLGVLCDRVN